MRGSALRRGRSADAGSWDASVLVRAITKRSKHQPAAVWITVRGGARRGPVRVRFDRLDARLAETSVSCLLGVGVREVEAQLLVGIDSHRLVGLNELKGKR